MSRPKCCRNIGVMPEITCFKPVDARASSGDEVFMTLDEFEAVRLAYYEGMYQEQAAAMMNVSRPTFGRIIESAQSKLADFLVNGKGLRITGGDVFVLQASQNPCEGCKRASERCDRGEDAGRCPFCRKGGRKSSESREVRSRAKNNS